MQPNNNNSNRIDPRQIQASVMKGKSQVATTSSFGDVMNTAGALAPAVGVTAAQTTGSGSAASVLYAAFSAMPGAYAAGKGTGGGYAGGSAIAGDEMGLMGGGLYSNPGTGAVAGDAAGLGTSPQQLMQTMNANNLNLLGLQSMLQNNMQSWSTKSNVLKSAYEAKMNMIQKFSVRG